jgi:membrane protein YqaA with SNARE-associated domain
MDNIADYLEESVRGLGSVAAGFGLFMVAFFDSSLLSLPEINDLLLIYFGTQVPSKAYYYALMTVLGSASGASLLYWVARWQGYGFLKKRFSDGKIDSVFRLFDRYGALAIAVPAILPPPFPFKIFVLSSGVFGVPYSRFLAAILLGRSFRYFGEAFLAVRFGEVAITFLRENATRVLLGTLLVLGIGLIAAWLLRRRRRFEAETKLEAPRPMMND